MINTKKQNTFYIHDYETFGKNPSTDRPAQFAGVRTDMDFNIIDDPLVMYCSPSNDYLPDPEAVIITGITPQIAKNKGLDEVNFAYNIHKAFNIPNTCIVGYNNINFDDEFSRNIFYRNFLDPYSYSWKNGNSRWDLIHVIRAYYSLYPKGIIWPKNKHGYISFRLEHITQANNIPHTQAHDAISDVYATIAIAKKIKLAQPKLFNFLLKYRKKNQLNTLINITKITPLVYISNILGAIRNNTTWIVPIAWHPQKKNIIIICDLSCDLTLLLTLKIEQLQKKIFNDTNNINIKNLFTLPLKLIHMNKCPILIPAKILSPQNAERLGINRKNCLKNLELLHKNQHIRKKIIKLFSKNEIYKNYINTDVDSRLYEKFFNNFDKIIIKQIQKTKPENLSKLNLKYYDNRIPELLFRFRARNYPNTLNDYEKKHWLEYRKKKLNTEFIKKYFIKIEKLYQLYKNDKEKIKILKELLNYSYKIIN